MKKVIKIIGFVLLTIVAAAAIGLFILSKLPDPAERYYDKIETGGEIEAKYLTQGSYETAYYEEPTLQWFKKYEIWYPKELESSDRTYPVIVVCNGTGQKGSKQKNIYQHYASWGFIVIDTEETYSWNAFGAEMCIRHLQLLNESSAYNDKENIFYNRVDFENVGIIGHSQGGAAVINAVTNTDHQDIYKAAVSLSPTNKELSRSLEWPYDAALIDIPIMIISGEGGGDDWVITGEQLEDLYNDIPGSKLAMRRKNTSHGETVRNEDGYVMAWFMWQLQGDEEAARAFTGSSPEIMNNPLYQDQKVDIK